MMKRKLAILSVLLCIACGKKGDPTPPVPMIPKSTSDLSIAQQGSRVVLTWSYPVLTTSGTHLSGLESITVYRYVEELPPSLQGKDPRTLTPGETNLGAPPEVSLFAKVPPIPAEQFSKLAQKLDSIAATALPNYTLGASLSYIDRPDIRTTDGRPVRITYSVVTRAKGGAKSEFSNLATVVPLNVPAAPEALKSETAPAGIVLRWNAPSKGLAGDSPSLVGYNVYRFSPDGDLGDLGHPVNTAIVKDTTYTDVPPYGKQRYAVTAVAMEGKPFAQSDPSEPVAAEFVDVVPPPAPSGLTTLLEEKAVRLLWDPVDAPDFAGYKVYRILGGDRVLLTPKPIKETNFRDDKPEVGLTYTYAVSSIDRRGNESAPTTAPPLLVPR